MNRKRIAATLIGLGMIAVPTLAGAGGGGFVTSGTLTKEEAQLPEPVRSQLQEFKAIALVAQARAGWCGVVNMGLAPQVGWPNGITESILNEADQTGVTVRLYEDGSGFAGNAWFDECSPHD